MKTYYILLLTTLFAFCYCEARDMKLTWNKFTPEEQAGMDGVMIQTRLKPEDPWVELGRVTADVNTYSGVFPAGEFEVCAVSFKKIVTQDGEEIPPLLSERSRWIRIPVGPPVPKGFNLEVTINLNTSENLKDWKTIAKIVIPQLDAAPAQFFQLQ